MLGKFSKICLTLFVIRTLQNCLYFMTGSTLYSEAKVKDKGFELLSSKIAVQS